MSKTIPRPKRGEPAWDIAQLFPGQGDWDEEDYFALPGNRPVEFDNGFIQVMPSATTSHQRCLGTLYIALHRFVDGAKLGKVILGGVPLRLWKAKYRAPDLMFLRARHLDEAGERFWGRSDLVIEIVGRTPEDRARDLVEKRADYARGRIPEYWIVDPQEEEITVLRLSGQKYVVHGKFGRGDKARSALLKGFEVAVDDVYDQR